jgi:spermidine synthase
MYHVLSTSLTAILLYLVSYFFYRIGYFSLQLHRKFWNLLLAMAFFLTAIVGIFIALQMNYKWNISFVKEILRWHVEFGIGLAVTGLIHFFWHLNYYRKYFSITSVAHENPKPLKISSSEIKTNLFIIGFISSSIQFMMMREIMNITGGYELITGSFLGSWLIASAIGASLASQSALNDIRKINLVFALSPVVSVILMLFLTRLFLSPGETPSLLASMIYTFLVLFPFCMVSGFTFIRLIQIAVSENNFVPGKSFSIETKGGIFSGIIISLLTAELIGSYKLLLLIILLSVTYVLITYYIKRSTRITIFKFFVLSFCCLIIFLDPDILFRQILLPSVKVTSTNDTPYGNITKGKYKGEESVYYNQRLLSYNDDATEREEDIHYAMLQCDSPEKVILISGSLQSHLPEILKYPVSKITYIERDPFLARYETPLDEKFPGSVAIVNRDAFRYIRNTNESVDIIILLVPPPTTLLLNRYYTSEFFYEVKKKLKPNGIFMCSPGPGDSYFNKESLNLYSSIYNGLTVIFKNVKPVVGNKLYFIASDKQISLSFCQIGDRKNIKNIYVNSDYLDDERIIKKSEEVAALINREIKPNRSAFPVACFHSQSYQFSKYLDEKIPAIVLMFIVFALPVTTIKRKNLLMYFSASSLAGFEIIILITLQLMVGNMYQLTGLIIAGLMTGLAVGSGINSGLLNTISLRNKVIFQILFYIIFALSYKYMLDIKSGLLSVAVILLSGFLPALITGRIFSELTLRTKGFTDSPSIYSADLAGSAFGFIFISGIAIPVFGIQASVFFLAVLLFGGILFGRISSNE